MRWIAKEMMLCTMFAGIATFGELKKLLDLKETKELERKSAEDENKADEDRIKKL